MSAKVAVWPAKDSAIFTFSSMGRSKNPKAHKPKTPFPINNLIIMFQSPKTLGCCKDAHSKFNEQNQDKDDLQSFTLSKEVKCKES